MYEFGHCRIRVAERLFERDGEVLTLQPKTFDLLVYLVRNAGRLVHKEELLEKVWSDSHVEEANLAVHVSSLRKVLGGAADEYIVTVPKFGYRFVAEVRPVSPAAEAVAEPLIEPATQAAPTPDSTLGPAVVAPPMRPDAGRNYRGLFFAVALLLASGAFVLMMKQRQTEWNPMPLTASAAVEMSPALSPDGKRIIYSLRGTWHSTPDPETTGLRMKTVGSDEVTVLTQKADFNAAWSPDGKEIAFFRFVPLPGMMDDSFLIVRSMVSGEERSVAKVNYRSSLPGPGVSYSLDGKWLLTSLGTGFFDGSSPRHLVAIQKSNGEVVPLFDPPKGLVGDSNPVLSPQGDRLAFCRCRSINSCDLYEVKLSGFKPVGEARRVTDYGMSEFRAVYLKDGSLLYPYGPPNARVLWRAGTDWLGRPFAEQIAPGGDDVAQPTIATGADGEERLAYVRTRVDSNIYELDLVSGKATNGGKPLIASNQMDQTPAYSPDGQRIAFASTRSGTWEIWTCDRRGEQCRQLTHVASAFTRNPTWSSDGKWLAYESRSKGEAQLFVIEVGSRKQQQISKGDAAYSDPFWSQDGKHLYFTSNRSGRPEIYRSAYLGEGKFSTAYEQVTVFGGSHAQLAPDGKNMLFTGTDLLSNRMSLGADIATQPADSRSKGPYFIYPPTAGHGSYAYGLLFDGENAFWGRLNWETFQVDRYLNSKYDRNTSVALSPDEKKLLWAQTDSTESDLAMVERLRY